MKNCILSLFIFQKIFPSKSFLLLINQNYYNFMFFLFFFLVRFLTVLSYDYYIFSQELPASVCKTRDCQKTMELNLTSSLLNIHGLWPETNSGEKAWFCQPNNYNESKLDQDLLFELDRSWVGLYTDSFWFRSHEWGKHGTCWNDTR
jgi:ribonuclease T2